MDNLPKELKPGAEYSLFISESESHWIINEKPEQKIDSVSQFRNDLRKLKTLRREMRENKQEIVERVAFPLSSTKDPVGIEDIEEVMTKSISINGTTDKITNAISKPSSLSSSTRLLLAPSNPLIDQTVKIIKPTEWIDCISRESKRVFVKDNWIVARILLPPVSKDSIGLKRLILE